LNFISPTIQLAEAFLPFCHPARYKAAFGGRGSSKSHSFAALMVAYALKVPGFRGICVREVQKSLKDSAKKLIEDKIQAFGVGALFDVITSEIKTPGGGLISFVGMQDHTAESIKSYEGYHAAWIEEAQTMSARSLELLRPTIRAPGSELWFSWNPRSADDPVDKFFRGLTPPKDAVIQKINYTDNKWFPIELEQERLHDLATNPDRYAHIWLGEYEPMAVGAIWSRQTIHANRRDEQPADLERIVVAVDPAISAEEHSDYHGIVAVGRGPDKRAYVLEDASLQGTPHQWAHRAIATYDRFDADAIVVERNQGGDMVKHTLRTIRPNIMIIEVVATKGKHLRAEPVAALYSVNRVSHVGTFSKLEDQMCQMTAAGYEGLGSPDRVDALVYAITELMPTMVRGKKREVTVENCSDYHALS
jgi:hypothetical protein